MRRPEHDRGRPGERTAPQDVTAGDNLSLDELDALAAHVDGAFVVVVHVTGMKYRRRCYLTAASAEAAARKATDRGENATVYLAELKPLWKIAGGAA